MINQVFIQAVVTDDIYMEQFLDAILVCSNLEILEIKEGLNNYCGLSDSCGNTSLYHTKRNQKAHISHELDSSQRKKLKLSDQKPNHLIRLFYLRTIQ